MSLRVLVALLLVLFINAKAVRTAEFIFQSFRKEAIDPMYFTEYSLDLVPFKNRNIINGTMTLAKTVDMFTLEFNIIVPRAMGNDIKFLNVSLNGCQALASSRKRNIVSLVMKELHKTKGFFPKKCPIQAGRTLFVDHFALSGSSLPMNLMDFTFNVRAHLLVNGKYIAKNFLNGTATSMSSKG